MSRRQQRGGIAQQLTFEKATVIREGADDRPRPLRKGYLVTNAQTVRARGGHAHYHFFSTPAELSARYDPQIRAQRQPRGADTTHVGRTYNIRSGRWNPENDFGVPKRMTIRSSGDTGRVQDRSDDVCGNASSILVVERR